MCLNRFGAESEAPLLCFFEFLKKKEEKEKEPTILLYVRIDDYSELRVFVSLKYLKWKFTVLQFTKITFIMHKPNIHTE